ncbi:3-(3-hydroxy-phenyl)propionate hydroxylase [Prauserella aidingensis]|uniref:bifunctional 3-(3-hydroxy-phenyl)propionate/3-hydroxycinnamic acid hydroxylase MhpA n=1 Tax=Prauserella aidingensis TaxID=387890 RepID=UPI0020A52405|nr:bifunctional 3-(3-hydroxy-phenyl)propionate/3-hydroxycinnamic acid hydroxylase [Prauserella aidingensis]MCP2256026.1 3-(3-hydroxy-phenyl)propionate hydroxylase [Prauserella aidingensis]
MSIVDEPRASTTTSDAVDADVLIVGYGPVGQSLAALLGASGHHVLVCERRVGRYETPRAGHFDHEIMRVFQSLGIADDVRRIAEPARVYEFLDADGGVISRLPREWAAPSGWDASYHFYQPELEGVLDAAVRRCSTVDVRFGAELVDLRQGDNHVVATLADGGVVTARYVVGADGVNSAVRALCGIRTDDLGFRGDWLVVDVRPRPGVPALDIPDTGQVLDPARPNHMGRVAQRYFRWEFMLVEGDDPTEMVEPERVWELLKPWIGPQEGEVIRRTVYQFRSVVADTFRRRSVLLAGDAAHAMPPFLGQGMSSGIRDAATLSWMFDLVLTGAADPKLLDLYTASRKPQVTAYIEESVRVGTVVCDTDPVRAAQRRDEMRSTTELPPPFQPPVGAGFQDGQPLAGRLAVQPLLRTGDGKTVRSDDELGRGFNLFSMVELDAATTAAVSDLERAIGLRSVVVGAEGLQEEGGALSDWLKEHGVVAVLVRPDFYVFGTATGLSEITGLLASLRASLWLV